MASNIDASKPVSGTPTTASVRDNFAAAKEEIEALQNRPHILMGSIAIYSAQDLNFENAQSLASVTIVGTALGVLINFAEVLWNDFGAEAFDRDTYPGSIIVPAGAARLTLHGLLSYNGPQSGLLFTRIGANSAAHQGNELKPVTPTTIPLTTQVLLLDVPVTPGTRFAMFAQQNSGVAATFNAGNLANLGANNRLTAQFYT